MKFVFQSDWLRAGRSEFDSLSRPDQLCGTPSLLSNWYQSNRSV